MSHILFFCKEGIIMLKIVRVQKNEESKILFFFHSLLEHLSNAMEQAEYFKQTKQGDQLIKKAIQDECLYVGIVQNRLVSLMVLDHNNEKVNDEVSVIYSIAVDPAYFGHGIANQMISYAIDHSREKGSEYLHLVVLENHAKTLDVYEDLGFFYEGQHIEKEDDGHLFYVYKYPLKGKQK